MIDVPIQVKDALREGRLRKNYRFQVLNDDGTVDFTIDNDNLVSESVNIDERMCSGDQIKYGLCEGSSLEFQYFGKENITGRRLKVFVDVEYEDESAYTYTDVEEFPRFDPVTITTPGHYKVYSAVEGVSFDVYLTRGSKTTSFDSVATEDGAEIVLGELKSGDSLELTWGSMFWTAPMLQVGTAAPYAIPMGYFTVKNCSRQASTGIIKAVCYNKLQSDYLDAKANLVLANNFTQDFTLTNFDIRRTLLSDYQIIENPKQYVRDINRNGYSIPSYQTSIGTYSFDSLYGINSPLNAYTWEVNSTSTTFELLLSANCIEFNFNAWTLIEPLYGAIEELEKNIFDDLKNIINSARLSGTWEDACAAIAVNGGFQNFFGITIIIGNSSKTYSTYQWEYEKEHGLSHTVDGPIKDMDRIWETGGVAQIMIPYGIVDTSYMRYISLEGYVSKNFSNQYQYYINAGLTELSDSYPVPYAEFSDGTPYKEYIMDEESNIDYAISPYTYDLKSVDKINFKISTMPEFTLRELQSATFETLCQFGELDRETDLFSGVELNNSRLLPADTLYPDNALYPDGAQESAFRSQYSKLWADEGNVHKWRYLIITYKGLDGDNNETEYTLQRTVNNDGTDDYNCSDNWLFKNLIWTASQIGDYADAMVAKMRDITWFPFEMWCAGLPYIETGDEIEIPLGNQTYTSYILQRQLKGIQNLQDTYINGTLDIF